MSIPSEDVLLNALNNSIRREVLLRLKEGQKTYSQLLNYFAISTGKLNYHLKLLKGLLQKTEEGLYQITPLGNRSLEILDLFRTEISEEERPMIREAFLSQKKSDASFLHLMYVSRMQFKFILLMIVSGALILSSIIYLSLGGSWAFSVPMIAAGISGAIGGGIWVRKVKKSAPDFINRIDRLLEKTD